MKELSVEEKAKRYDEAIKKAKSKIKNDKDHVLYEDYVIEMFPELAESEDEKIRKGIIRNLEYLADRAEGFVKDELKERIAWLEKQGKLKSSWSEEDERMLNEVILGLKVLKYKDSGEEEKAAYQREIDWLESLKDRVQPQPKHGWSEEDKKIIDRIESEFLALHRGDYKNINFNNVDNLSVLNWVRKIKFLCFQSRWKPSDEQMNTLEYYMHTLVCNEHKEILFGLYSCLKKLREE